MNYAPLLEPIHQFLHCRTPQAWIDEARKPENLTLLLTDHMVCELKAAQTAVWLIRKYVADKPSGDAILAWLKPYEDFIFGEDHDSNFINAHKNLTKSIIVRNELPWADDLVGGYLCIRGLFDNRFKHSGINPSGCHRYLQIPRPCHILPDGVLRKNVRRSLSWRGNHARNHPFAERETPDRRTGCQ